jgi:lipopolysaccharide export system protein LptA
MKGRKAMTGRKRRAGTGALHGLGRALFFIAMMVPPLAFAQTAQTQVEAQAQTQAPERGPLEITADQTLEWHRGDNRFVAIGNVLAKQGGTAIRADRLTALYRATPGKSFDIYQLVAEGHVAIAARGGTAQGDKAVYEVDKGMAALTGADLRLAAPGQVVTARDSFEYNVRTGTLVARGRAQAVRGEDRIEADRMSATFSKDARDGSGPRAAESGPAGIDRSIQRLEADGNVVITTPAEVLTGDTATYSSADNTARLTGHVRIAHGPNTLEGDSAEVNLATNVSVMHGGAENGGRVRGLFYPDTVSHDGAAANAPSVPAGSAPVAPPATAPAPATVTAPGALPGAVPFPPEAGAQAGAP